MQLISVNAAAQLVRWSQYDFMSISCEYAVVLCRAHRMGTHMLQTYDTSCPRQKAFQIAATQQKILYTQKRGRITIPYKQQP